MSNLLAMLVLIMRMFYCMAKPRCILFWWSYFSAWMAFYFLMIHTDTTQLIIDSVCLFAFIGFMVLGFLDELSRVRASKS